jgi:hypothetical protein
MDLRTALKDKRVQVAAGGAGLLGLFVLARRGGGDGSATYDDEPTTVGGGYVANPAFADTTGADLANILGQYSGDLQGQLTEYRDSLADAIDAMKDIETPNQTGTGTVDYRWHSSVPERIRGKYDADKVAAQVRKSGVKLDTRHLSVKHVEQALRKRGYRDPTPKTPWGSQPAWVAKLMSGKRRKKKKKKR